MKNQLRRSYSTAKMNINGKIASYIKQQKELNRNVFIIMGSRRSGKTYTILQYLLLTGCNNYTLTNIAGQTAEQLRLGTYADCVDIIGSEPYLASRYELLSSPREIRGIQNKSKIFFNSYPNSERAKGVASDYLYINEANNFSLTQYYDLAANIRKGIFLDYNPTKDFWVNEIFDKKDILHTTWKDNPFLTDLQKQYFYTLKEMAERPNATAVDVYNYKVNYLGEVATLDGDIFTRGNIQRLSSIPSNVIPQKYIIFCDPAALRGADHFACVLVMMDTLGDMYVLDTFSPNTGSPDLIIDKLINWCASYDVQTAYIEVNGIIGIKFYEDYACKQDGLPVASWYSHENKLQRILANYQNLTNHTWFVDHAGCDTFLDQVYDFGEKCLHDDNIDSVNSAWNALHFV